MSLFDFFRNRKHSKEVIPTANNDSRNVDEIMLINNIPVYKWYSVVERAFKDYNSLSDDEKIWFNLRGLIDAVCDGGLISYYYNFGAVYIYETIQNLEFFEMHSILDIIKYYNQIIFGEIEVPKDLDERNEYIRNLTEDESVQLDKLEDKIWEEKLMDKLEDILTEYLNDSKDNG